MEAQALARPSVEFGLNVSEASLADVDVVTTQANQSTAYDAVPKMNAMNSFRAMNE